MASEEPLDVNMSDVDDDLDEEIKQLNAAEARKKEEEKTQALEDNKKSEEIKQNEKTDKEHEEPETQQDKIKSPKHRNIIRLTSEKKADIQEKTEEKEDKVERSKVKRLKVYKNQYFYKYKAMRNLKGGPQSFKSFKFWVDNGCKDRKDFLKTWKQNHSDKLNRQINARSQRKETEENSSDGRIKIEKVFNINLNGQGCVGVHL